jgi:FkbM family methyltransferase
MISLSWKFADVRYRLFYGLLLRRGFELVTLCAPGSICPWTICPKGLNAGSVVYSGGVGSDISFEHELVKKFGCDVVLLDPTPAGLRTMSLPENRIPQFHYFPQALAARTGKLSLAPPPDGGDSWFARNDGAPMEVSCTDLGSLMAGNGHQHIDLLKLDIEGCEYEVIDDLLLRRIPIRQICVEFHHGIVPDIRRSQTIRSMLKLITRGYKLLNQEGANHTFLRTSWPASAL